MKILIACEESQTVCKAFRAKGHEAYSCDILPCSGGHPEWHLRGDVREFLYPVRPWDMIIAHPACTYIANSGVRWLYLKDGSPEPRRWLKLMEAIDFFNLFKNHPCPKICIENPIPHKYAVQGTGGHKGIGKYTQTIQPYEYGHTTSKRTCLWLKGLPNLIPTKIIPKEERTQEILLCPPGPDRQKIRSKTFSGIAEAMADQWG